jgi:hypothetical protein
MGRKKKVNPKQIPLFVEQCPHHGPSEVCTECPGKLSTDNQGFVHPRDAAGRVPLRRCRECGLYKRKENWSVTDWFACKECAVFIAKAKAAYARALKTGEAVFDEVQESAARGWELKAGQVVDETGREIK